MKTKIKEKWITALESGDYVQGRKTLHNITENTFCCLGVLCDLAVKEGVIPPPTIYSTSKIGTAPEQTAQYGREEATALLPVEVSEWADVDANSNYYPAGEDEQQLSNDNDHEMMTFPEIVEIIKEYF